jgi:TonB-dependent starch-binding outer membrane protein SusC
MIKIKNASVSKNRWMYPAIPLSCLLVVSSLTTQATPFAPVKTNSKLSLAMQQTTIRGKVVDKDGKGIANVTVQIKGTNLVTTMQY